jgi:signal transduction histidine kinase
MDQIKVLICEDESLVALDLQRQIQNMGHQVLGIASNSDRAIELVKHDRPDIVVMDVHLDGEVSGTALAKVLGQQFELPSIFLTGDSDSDTIEAADASYPLGYLIKPVQADQLAVSLRYGMAQHRAKGTLKRRLREASADAVRSKKIIAEFRSTLASEVRMGGLQEIIGGIAHHFNNSLLAVSLPLDVLLTGGTLEAYELRLAQRMRDCYERDKVFVQRLMWSSGNAALSRAAFPIDELVKSVILNSSNSIPPGVKVVTHFQSEPLWPMVDREALSHALSNILRNALEAVGQRGEIEIRLELVHVENPEMFNSSVRPGQFVEVSISDSGDGIESDVLEHVAEPFFTTHEERVATGLGLTEAYGIAQKHDGWLTVSSRPGSGTHVSFFLPYEHSASTRSSDELDESESPPRALG